MEFNGKKINKSESTHILKELFTVSEMSEAKKNSMRNILKEGKNNNILDNKIK